jgi:two-component system response regulator RegX3
VSGRPRVLLIEDDDAIASPLAYTLEAEGFEVHLAGDGRRGLEMARELGPDLVLLDLLLPGLPGIEVCRALRKESAVPILVISAKGSEADKVALLELGADDYLTKPFGARELVARVRAALRRSRGAGPAGVLRVGELELDPGRHEVRVGGRRVELTPKEFELLRVMMTHPGQLLTRSYLIETVWGYPGETKTLDVHVGRLRAKLERDPEEPRLIRTVRGLGYIFGPREGA